MTLLGQKRAGVLIVYIIPFSGRLLKKKPEKKYNLRAPSGEIDIQCAAINTDQEISGNIVSKKFLLWTDYFTAPVIRKSPTFLSVRNGGTILEGTTHRRALDGYLPSLSISDSE